MYLFMRKNKGRVCFSEVGDVVNNMLFFYYLEVERGVDI